MQELLNSRNLSPKIWLDTKPRIRNQRTFGETDIMRKQWKLSAQRLLTLSAFGILTGFSVTGLTNAAEQTKPGVIIASEKPAAGKPGQLLRQVWEPTKQPKPQEFGKEKPKQKTLASRLAAFEKPEVPLFQ